MNIVIFFIVGLIAVAFLFDAMRQSKKRSSNTVGEKAPDRILTADESGPTETGRFRVQQALGAAPLREGGSKKDSSGTAEPSSDSEGALPDPFNEEKS